MSTNKITRKEAERQARNSAYMTAFSALATDTVCAKAEEVYQSKLAELEPRIIPESPWRTIEECPKIKNIQYFIGKRNNWGAEVIEPAYWRGSWCNSETFNSIVWEPTHFIEIPALPNKVVS